MTDGIKAASPSLNQPIRTLAQAQADIEAGRAQAERQRVWRLEQHGPRFCRQILAGAFERAYDDAGSYTLRPVAERPAEAPAPGRHPDYLKALIDVSAWIWQVALNPRMCPDTLDALNAEIERLRRGGRVQP